ncbi:MAG: arsenite methyltransferase [Spirochaetes bacterium]|nr:arsenite methyltransferase [Spirochaetota bacterium]
MESNEKIKKIVKQNYGSIALLKTSCCSGSSCCTPADVATKIGYSENELAELDSANLGLGCGNPNAIATLKEGEVVLDLGSGAGIDCFLASRKVGSTGKVIGIDMTPEMIALAKENAQKLNITNVEFILGDIEDLPVENDSIDVILSNCVINLAPDKEKVFNEAYRVLKNHGRLVVSDIVLEGTLPNQIKNSIDAYVSCIAGAIQKEEYISLLYKAGFTHVEIVKEYSYSTIFENEELCSHNVSNTDYAKYKDVVKSISIIAWK